MTVTAIEMLSRARRKIYLDGEFAFVLYKGELHTYEIREGESLEEKNYHEIMETLLPKRAKLRAMNLLKTKTYTEQQLRKKLLDGGYPEEVAETAIAYVKSYRYVDDLRYVEEYIEYHREGRSRRDMEQRLLQKGISREVMQEAFAGLSETAFEEDEKALLRWLLQKKGYDGSPLEEKEKQRLYGFFYRKGFALETVKRVMREWKMNEE